MGTHANHVSLMWSASSDNVGVTQYRVFRNGAQIGTATGLTYEDMSVSAGQTYTYTVRAVDAAGNVSAASNALTVTTPTGSSPSPSPTDPGHPGHGDLPQWNAFGAYTTGDRVVHEGQIYEAIQPYQGWGDPNWIYAPSLWRAVGEAPAHTPAPAPTHEPTPTPTPTPTAEPEPAPQPTPQASAWKSTGVYQVGALVAHQGSVYECTRSHISLWGSVKVTNKNYWKKIV